MVVFLGLVITLIVCQNLLAVGLSHVLHLNPLIGMCTGSIPMVGGHGTAGAFDYVLEDFNIQGSHHDLYCCCHLWSDCRQSGRRSARQTPD